MLRPRFHTAAEPATEQSSTANLHVVLSAPSPPACMSSRRVQCAEARIVMDLRRARCAGSRSRSPPPAPEPMPPPLHCPVASEIGIEEDARIIVSPLFRSKRDSPDSAPTGNTASHATGAHVPRQLVVPDSGAPKHDNGGSTPLSSPRKQPTSTSGERMGGTSQPGAKPTCGSGSNTLGVAANKRRQRHQHQKQQQQLSPRASLRHGTSNPPGAEDRFFQNSQGSHPPAGRAVIGSERYIEKRKQRAALSEGALRQLGSEHVRLKAFIEASATKMAQVLLRRLAAEKQQGPATVTATDAATADDAETPLLPTPERAEKAEGRDDRDADDVNCTPIAARLGRHPWRPGGATGTFLTEKRRCPEENCRTESRSPVAVAKLGEDVYREHARAAVGQIVRRACLNLVNRPWRLAGVRLASDPPLAGGKRRRAGGARVGAKSCIAALVRDVSEAVRRSAPTKSNYPEPAFCERVPQRRGGGGGGGGSGGGSGGSGSSGGPGCRRLVRLRTSPNAGRGRLGKPSPPPHRSRRRPPPSRGNSRARNMAGGDGAGKEHGSYGEGGVRCEGRGRDRSSRWRRAPTARNFGLVRSGGFDEREEVFENVLLGEGKSEEELETSGDGWIPSLKDYWEERSGTPGADVGDQAEPRWWPGGYYSGGRASPTSAATPRCQPEPHLGLPFPQASDYFEPPDDSPRCGGPRPEQLEAREDWGGRTAGGGSSAGLGRPDLGRSQASSRPRRSFIPRSGGRRRRGGRPRWDDRFGFSTCDASARGRETSATFHRSRTPSPFQAPHTQGTSMERQVQEVATAAGAPTVAVLPLQTPRDIAARSKLAELKREHTLREIGHKSCSAGPAAGDINLVVSELCTVSIGTLPPTAEIDESEMFGPMLPGEDVHRAILHPGSSQDKVGGSSTDGNGIGLGPAGCNTERRGRREEGATAARASRGVLLEFVWPPAQRSTGQGLDEAAVHCPEWTGFSSARPSTSAQGQRQPKPRKRLHGLAACQCCPSGVKPPTAALSPAPAAPAAAADDDGQRCSADHPPSPKCRGFCRSQEAVASHGDPHRWPSPDRSGASFLVLTLGFLRRLVEVPLAVKDDNWFGTNHGSRRGLDVDAKRDERPFEWGDRGEQVGRGSGQYEQPPPAAEPPWRDLADALNEIGVLDAEQGLHSRLIDELSPILLAERLVPLIVGMFRPPPDVFRRCKLHHGRGSSSSGGGGGGGSGNTCCCGSSDVGIFLGSAVRDLLAGHNSRETNATSIDDDRPRHVGVRSVSNVSDVSGVADTARDGHIRIPTPDTAPSPEPQRRDGRSSCAWGTEVSSLPSQLGFGSAGGKDVTAGDAPSVEAPEDDSLSSSSLSSGGYSTTTFLDEETSVLSSITNHIARTTHLHPPTTTSGGLAHKSGSIDTNGDLRRKSLLREMPVGRGFPTGQEATPPAEDVNDNNRASRGAVCRFPNSGGFDLAVLAEMLRANTHIEYFGLARDARMFAGALNRLAGDSSSSGSHKMRQLPARTKSKISKLSSSN